MDNIIKQNIVLAKLNAILDIICFATDKKVKLEQELKKLEQEEKENKQQEVA
jgi:hypothetical protein